MKKAVIYIHGLGGNAEEAEHYQPIFKHADVIGFAYKANTPWEAKEEFREFFDCVRKEDQEISLIANSIGAFFAMTALSDRRLEKAMFISPIVNMEQLISDRMIAEHITEEELQIKQEIETSSGQALSWEYLCYVRTHPVKWAVPTEILYGEKDNLTSYETLEHFAEQTGAAITVMKGGEHWFHTEEQMRFLDEWMSRLAPDTSV